MNGHLLTSRLVSVLKRMVVALIGRPRANQLAAPVHLYLARRRTLRLLSELPAKDLLINVGCGYRPLTGWINIDLVPGYAEVVWDVRQPLPFPDRSVSAIFCEHVIEHLDQVAGAALIREFYRMLQPGGVLRISTPDAGRYLKSYANEDGFLDHPRFGDGSITSMDLVNKMMRENGGHLWVYDYQSLAKVLRNAGFNWVEQSLPGDSTHQRMSGIDSPEREYESLYVEAGRSDGHSLD